jgi:hypothetical protein
MSRQLYANTSHLPRRALVWTAGCDMWACSPQRPQHSPSDGRWALSLDYDTKFLPVAYMRLDARRLRRAVDIFLVPEPDIALTP